jgi:hypothetical protein
VKRKVEKERVEREKTVEQRGFLSDFWTWGFFCLWLSFAFLFFRGFPAEIVFFFFRDLPDPERCFKWFLEFSGHLVLGGFFGKKGVCVGFHPFLVQLPH